MKAKALLLSAGILSVLLLSACPGDADLPPQAPIPDSLTISRSTGLSLEECLVLDAEYSAAITAAQGCDPVSPARQCTLLRATSLSCPCVAYLNPRNTDALEQARAVEHAWRSGDCRDHVYDCPALPCPAPKVGECRSSSSADGREPAPGACVNVY